MYSHPIIRYRPSLIEETPALLVLILVAGLYLVLVVLAKYAWYLRDEQIVASTPAEIAALAKEIRDHNYRIFAADGEVHVVSSGLHLHNADPFVVMQQLAQAGPGGGLPKNLDAEHAFYLGYEMCKALTALTLGKTYRQDEALDWGLATRPEQRHYLKHERGGDKP